MFAGIENGGGVQLNAIFGGAAVVVLAFAGFTNESARATLIRIGLRRVLALTLWVFLDAAILGQVVFAPDPSEKLSYGVMGLVLGGLGVLMWKVNAKRAE